MSSLASAEMRFAETVRHHLGTSRILGFLLASALVVGANIDSSRAQDGGAYPRSETLYTGGTQWGNIVGFNPYVGSYATGTIGLVYETLVRYDPLKDAYIPWLAEKGEWTGPEVYTLTIREGVTWNDGTPFTAEDVKWNIDLGRFETMPWSVLYQGIKSVEVDGNTVVITFSGTPKYQDWQNQLWSAMAMVQPSQWQDHANELEITTWSPEVPIGTGPYVLDEEGFDPLTRVVWTKDDEGWWAAKAGLLPDPEPKYIIDMVNSSNSVALSLILGGQQDMNTNYLPGISTLAQGGYNLKTYYEDAPFMLSANTAWLLPNTTKAPMDDVSFRRALAHAINIDQIVNINYGNLVLPANPTGLLPIWSDYINEAAVKEHGFSYNTEKAIEILEEAGYQMGDDGLFKQPNGEPISLRLAVPAGWSDWMQATQMIAEDAKAAGIELTPTFPDYNNWQTERNSGTFDMIIENSAQMSDSPYSYYRYLYRLPVRDSQTNFNFSRIENEQAWSLVEQLNATPPEEDEAISGMFSELQTIFLQELPQIPLWYNGVWSQANTSTWTNWPSADSDRNYMPALWRGYLQMTGIDMIAHLKPAKTQ